MTTTLAIVDAETTGLVTPQVGYPAEHFDEMWELAVRIRDHHNPALDGSWCWQFSIDENRVHPRAREITHFDTRYRARGAGVPALLTHYPKAADHVYTLAYPDAVWNLSTVARVLVQLLSGAHWIGCVPDFDTSFVIPFLLANGQLEHWPERPWHYHLIDVENLAAGRLQLPPPWDSEQLSRQLGVKPPPPHERHTALGDVLWAERMYDAVMTVPAALPVSSPLPICR